MINLTGTLNPAVTFYTTLNSPVLTGQTNGEFNPFDFNAIESELEDAKVSEVKDKTFDSLDARFEETESDVKIHKEDIDNPHSVTAELVGAYTKEDVDTALADKADKSSLTETNLRIATVDKSLSDYQNAIAQINPNQEAKQTASGYGAVSLPVNAANGQISASVRGNTIVWNQLVNDSKFYPSKTESGITFTNNGDGTVTVNGTATNDVNYICHTHTNIDSHTYAFYGCPTGGSSETYSVGYGGGYKEYGNGLIIIPSSVIGRAIVILVKSGATATNLVFKPQLFDLTQMFGAGNEPSTVEQFRALFPQDYYPYDAGTAKSTISAGRLVSANEDETETTYQYYPDVGLLRSLPNGTKDEVRVSDGKLIKRVSDEVVMQPNSISVYDTSNPNVDIIMFNSVNLPNSPLWAWGEMGQIAVQGWTQIPSIATADSTVADIGKFYTISGSTRFRFVVAKGAYTNLTDARSKFPPTTLTYQLAEPIVTPVNVTGTLVGHPNGTIYFEPVLPVAGVYTASGIEVTDTDYAIDTLERIAKIDFMTGVETEVDVSQAVIAGDGLSFTHPDLIDGDIVFFTYYHAVEGTQPEITAEYYDSRYVLKDSVTGKFYKEVKTVTSSELTTTLVEV